MQKTSHTRRIRSFLFTFSLLAINFAGIGFAAAPLELSDDAEVKISADEMSYDSKLEAIKAKGNVKLTRGTTVIESGSLTFFDNENRLIAKEGVTVTEKEDSISGEEMEYDFEKSTARIKNGKIFVKEANYHIKGEEIEKTGKETYRISGAIMTTCDGDSPSWHIKASKVDLEIGEYLVAKHARLYARRVPLLYFPVLIAPIKTDRQTGLLAPKFGYSSRWGLTYDQPLFLALSRSQDATLTFNYEANRAYGGELEYRYVRTADSEGTARIKYVFEHYSTDNERWVGSYRHRENFSKSLYGRISLEGVSDRAIYTDYGQDVNIYSRQSLESQASLVKNWSNYSLLTNFRYFKNLLINEDTTLQRLPEMILRGNRRPIGKTPVHFQLDSRINNFWREKTDEESGLYAGQRFDFHPSFSLPLRPWNIMELTPKLGLRETLYRTRDKDNRSQSRELYDFELDFSIPFMKIYDTDIGDVEKVKHTVAPGLTFYRTPEEDQSALPSYDSIDRISERKQLLLKLENFFVTKSHEEEQVYYNRLVEFKLFRYYDFIEADRQLLFAGDRREPWGPVTGQLKVRGRQGYRFDSEVRYDTYQEEVTYGSADFSARRKNGDRLALAYRYTNVPDVRYLDSSLRYRLNDSVSVAYRGRYSISDGFFHENRYGLLLERQCWDLTLTYSTRRTPEEQRIFVLFNLKGLGEIGTKQGLFSN